MKAEPEPIRYNSQTDGAVPMRAEFNDEEIRNAFQTFDLDKNMFIGVSELKHVLKLIGEEATDEEIDEMIKLCDSDGSGQVSFDGFQRLFSAASSPISRAPRRNSLHKSEDYSNLTIPELMEEFSQTRAITPVYIRKVFRRFQQFDVERSGRVGYLDFLKVLESEDSALVKKLFDIFDYQLFNEIEMKPFLVNLILNSKNDIKLNEKLKISFALMRSSGVEDNALRKSEFGLFLKTLFMVFPKEIELNRIDSRVDAVFKLCSISAKNDSDPIISFDQFMDAVSAVPTAALPTSLVSEISE